MASWLVRSSMPRIERSGFEPWPGTLCCVLGRFVGGNLTNCWGVTCDGLASRPGGVEILLAASCYGNRDKLRPDGASWLYKAHFFYILQTWNRKENRLSRLLASQVWHLPFTSL